MSRLVWGQGARPIDEGLDHGVLYSAEGVASWDGLVSVRENDDGSVGTEHYIDGVRTVITQQLGDFSATLEAFTYPDEFLAYDGYSDDASNKRFGLSYRTPHGDGHHIHVVYNALARPQSRSWQSVAAQVNPNSFAWDISAVATVVPGASPTAHLMIDTNLTPEVVPTVEGWLYGTDTEDPRLPTPNEFVELFESATVLRISYNPDGTWTATGPSEFVQVNLDGSFTITAPTALHLDSGFIEVRSY